MDVPLRPDRAPRWLVPLLEAIADGGAEIPRRLLSPRVPQKDGADQAAVLILFAGDPRATELPEDARVLITHRTPRMRSHSAASVFSTMRRHRPRARGFTP